MCPTPVSGPPGSPNCGPGHDPLGMALRMPPMANSTPATELETPAASVSPCPLGQPPQVIYFSLADS